MNHRTYSCKTFTAILFILIVFTLILSCQKGKDPGLEQKPDNNGEESISSETSSKAGQEVDILSLIQINKINIIDFYSDFCPPCVQIAPLLDRLDKQRDDIAVIKIDINRPGIRGIDWNSPVIKQFQIRSIPYFMVFDKEGNKISEGQDAYTFVMETLRSEKIIP